MEVYDDLQILFYLRGRETGKKVCHGIEGRKDGLQNWSPPVQGCQTSVFTVTCIMRPLGSELVTDPDEEVPSFFLVSYIH